MCVQWRWLYTCHELMGTAEMSGHLVGDTGQCVFANTGAPFTCVLYGHCTGEGGFTSAQPTATVAIDS